MVLGIVKRYQLVKSMGYKEGVMAYASEKVVSRMNLTNLKRYRKTLYRKYYANTTCGEPCRCLWYEFSDWHVDVKAQQDEVRPHLNLVSKRIKELKEVQNA